ncbi:hypothetical protein DM01DRAFT_1301989 [Hesseltinella vesiculosa]|uniref:RING-type domain-containing protein n=1 Tax=Hesseltinella vesiculosa TaxID=101127 RepID=A0A1X2GNG3_9FUNG|nr:hypothetical protein DM01DRAFT_1301989 [Hesseltinella vesiculosa]
MPRHSKNNTAGSVFTYHETKSLDYGTKKQRLGRESFRNYDACFLCLQKAREPMTCSKGHLACRECLYENFLQQKEGIKRQEALMDQKLSTLDEKKRQEKIEAQQLLLDEFEKTQSSMLGQRKSFRSNDVPSASAGDKRKRETDQDDELARASEKLAKQKAQAAENKLKSSFWLPSVTPSAEVQSKDEIKPVQSQPQCHATKDVHSLTIKSMIKVEFTKDAEDKSICPSCLKGFSNSSKLCLMRPCGHVVCRGCLDMFVKKSKKCFVCETKIKSKDILDMSPEGTGFTSGSSLAVAEKFDVAFQ